MRFVWLHRQDRERQRGKRRMAEAAMAMRAASGEGAEGLEHYKRFVDTMLGD